MGNTRHIWFRCWSANKSSEHLSASSKSKRTPFRARNLSSIQYTQCGHCLTSSTVAMSEIWRSEDTADYVTGHSWPIFFAARGIMAVRIAPDFRLKKQGSIVLHSDLNGISKSCCRPVSEFHDMEQARKEASTYEVAKEEASPKLDLLEAHRGQPERQKSNFHHLRVR